MIRIFQARGRLLVLLFVSLLLGGCKPTNRVLTTEATDTTQATISQKKSLIPEDWSTYRNQEMGFEISFPSTYDVESTAADGIMITPPESFLQDAHIYVSVVKDFGSLVESTMVDSLTKADTLSLMSLLTGGELVLINTAFPDEQARYTRKEDELISNRTTMHFESDVTQNLRDNRYIVQLNDRLIVLGGYAGTSTENHNIDASQIESIAKTLKVIQ